MYVILVKNSDNSYDVLDKLLLDEERESKFDAIWDKDKPIIGMNASDHKATATNGSTWNGVSFDGTAAPGFFEIDQEKHNKYHLYVFLLDNKVIHRIALQTTDPKITKYDAAFSMQPIVVKVPEHQSVYAGETYLWNKTEFIQP
mgnify:CR=1 FL=1